MVDFLVEMMNKIRALLLTTVSIFSCSLPAFADWSYYTGTLQERQDTAQWCWASVTRAVLKHNKNIEREQCYLASEWVAGHGYTNYCCTGSNSQWGRPTPASDRTAACVQPFSVTTALNEFGAYESYISHPIDPAGLSGVEAQLQANTPPVAIIGWPNGTSHAITVVSGTNANNLTNYEIYDPWDGRMWITRANLKVYRTTGKWIATIHTK